MVYHSVKTIEQGPSSKSQLQDFMNDRFDDPKNSILIASYLLDIGANMFGACLPDIRRSISEG